MPARTRSTLEVREVRLERLAEEYRATIEAGGWPRLEHTPDGRIMNAPWAPRREAPFVCRTDQNGWVDQNNNCLVIPAEDEEHAGMWRTHLRYTYEWQGEDVRIWYGRDAAECMAWVDIVREEATVRWRRDQEAERPNTEPGWVWGRFNVDWHNANPGWYMPERLRIESDASARATWQRVYEEWQAEHPDDPPDWASIREAAGVRWQPEYERLMALEVSQEELEEEQRLWREAEANRREREG